MPVCKFFVRGNCRKGNNCNFEHVYPDEDYGDTGRGRGSSVLKRTEPTNSGGYNERYYEDKSQYTYNKDYRNVQGHSVTFSNDQYGKTPMKQFAAPQTQYNPPQTQYNPPQRYNDRYHYDPRQNQYKQQYQQSHAQSEITVDELYMLLKSDIISIENGKIWPLTSFSIIKLFGSLDDWYDYSPEEMRLAAYIAKATNNFGGYKPVLDKVVNRAQEVRNVYKATSKETSAKLKAYMKQPQGTIFPLTDNEFDFSRMDYSCLTLSTATSEFGSVQPTVFNENQTQMAEDTEMSTSTAKADFFGSPTSSPQQDFKPNVFGAVEQKPTSVFGAAPNFDNSNLSRNVFGGIAPSQPGSVFSQNQSVFGQSSSIGFAGTQPSQNVFGSTSTKPASFEPDIPRDVKKLYPGLEETDLNVDILSLVWHGDSPYSRKDELTEEEYEQFKAPKFTLGKIPLIPPPRELC